MKAKENKMKNSNVEMEMDPDLEFINLDDDEEENRKKKLKGLDTEVCIMAFSFVIFGLSIIVLLIFLMLQRNGNDVTTLAGESSRVDISVVEEEMLPLPTLQTAHETYYIDDIDFAWFNNKEESIESIVQKLENEYFDLKVFATTYYNGADAILCNGNLYRMHPENGTYQFFIIPPAPKKIEAVWTECSYIYINRYNDLWFYTFEHGEDCQGENLEIPVHVTYTDGQEEVVKLYITKPYI